MAGEDLHNVSRTTMPVRQATVNTDALVRNIPNASGEPTLSMLITSSVKLVNPFERLMTIWQPMWGRHHVR
ncbi:hypothetical protein IF1G_03022 [Cordyceps javanica]|uniref:Uncharacterized protein n=1 Tax=Cordyceps javanica TaxID=43265 RepID=A0A545VB34_9HYPO|nr:hypothetical protein IF1G_03022 [Cordyceps javanica]